MRGGVFGFGCFVGVLTFLGLFLVWRLEEVALGGVFVDLGGVAITGATVATTGAVTILTGVSNRLLPREHSPLSFITLVTAGFIVFRIFFPGVAGGPNFNGVEENIGTPGPHEVSGNILVCILLSSPGSGRSLGVIGTGEEEVTLTSELESLLESAGPFPLLDGAVTTIEGGGMGEEVITLIELKTSPSFVGVFDGMDNT